MIAAVLLLTLATPAAAHPGTGLQGGFLQGFEHPLSGPDHMLAMVSVGLWGAILGRPLLIVLPMIFPMMMAVGGALGMAVVPFPPVELGIALSVLVLGAVILFEVRAPVAIACTIVALFALFHGYAHGSELPSAADPVGYSLGFVIATGLLHILGVGIGSIRWVRRGDLALRGLGGVVAACGAWFLVAAIR